MEGLKEEREGRIRPRVKDEKVAGVAGGFFGAICISGSYLHGRARSNEKTMGEGARRRETSPLDPSPTVFWLDLVPAFARLYLLLTNHKRKTKQNKTKNTSYAARPGKRGRFGVNNSVVAGVPFPPFLACPNSSFSQPSFQGSLLAQKRSHVD